MPTDQRPPCEPRPEAGSRRPLAESLTLLGILLLIGVVVVTLRGDQPDAIAGVIGAVAWLVLPLRDGRL
jgi:hypothetical protein